MLVLNDNLLIGKGGRKLVYLDPRDKKKCIKITPLEKKKIAKKTAKHWYKKFRSLNCFDKNIVELKAHKSMMKKKEKNNGEYIYNHIPKFYEVVETNFGQGIVVDYLDNIISLRDYINNNGVTDNLILAMKEMFLNFIKYNIEMRDYTSVNYVIKLVNVKPKIYMIDGLGTANFIPLHRIIPYFGKKQTIRRIKKMLILLKNEFPEYKDKFEFEKIVYGSEYI